MCACACVTACVRACHESALDCRRGLRRGRCKTAKQLRQRRRSRSGTFLLPGTRVTTSSRAAAEPRCQARTAQQRNHVAAAAAATAATAAAAARCCFPPARSMIHGIGSKEASKEGGKEGRRGEGGCRVCQINTSKLRPEHTRTHTRTKSPSWEGGK